MVKKLTVNEVYRKSDLSYLKVQNTEEIQPLNVDIVQQNRAKDSIRFGLAMKKNGYNLFVSGHSTSKRRSFLLAELNKHASKLPVPNDLCYVYNFENESEPKLISLPSGKGVEFKNRMDEVINFLNTDVKNMFGGHSYRKEDELLNQVFDDAYDEIMDQYNAKLEPLNYGIYQGNDGGLYSVPIDGEGNFINQDEFDEFEEEVKEVYASRKKDVDLLMVDFVHAFQDIGKNRDLKKKEQDAKLVDLMVSPLLEDISDNFGGLNPYIDQYLSLVKEDILKDTTLFKEPEISGQQQVFQFMQGGAAPVTPESTDKYSVNIIVDHQSTEHAPVVVVDEFDPYTFFGRTEFQVEGNAIRTDFSLIRSGDLLDANGGFLVLDVVDLFKYPQLWEKFKSSIKNDSITINTSLYKDLVLANTMHPESIPFDVKVILLGDIQWYYLLLENDPDFAELFKVHALFEGTTRRNEDIEKEYIQFISKYIKDNDLKPFDIASLECILEYSSRLAHHQEELVLNYHEIQKLLDESDMWASLEGDSIVTAKSVEKAFEQQQYRLGTFMESHNKHLENGISLISTTGEKVGVINALTVLDYGDIALGQPSRLTANTYVGSGGVISIDRNVKMSGKIHDRGVDTISGLLNKEFAQNYPLSLTANVTFEQNYGGVDGDSATSTTLYAILSDMSEFPINQSIGVTGSMNQKGEVQAIGGVNEKTEGFFQACKLQGLTGSQGVLIPSSNVQNLMLSKEVREAIRDGLFHVYAVDNVYDGIELLTGQSYDTIKTRIEKKLSSIREATKKTEEND